MTFIGCTWVSTEGLGILVLVSLTFVTDVARDAKRMFGTAAFVVRDIRVEATWKYRTTGLLELVLDGLKCRNVAFWTDGWLRPVGTNEVVVKEDCSGLIAETSTQWC